jgi:hypothetical protein
VPPTWTKVLTLFSLSPEAIAYTGIIIEVTRLEATRKRGYELNTYRPLEPLPGLPEE